MGPHGWGIFIPQLRLDTGPEKTSCFHYLCLSIGHCVCFARTLFEHLYLYLRYILFFISFRKLCASRSHLNLISFVIMTETSTYVRFEYMDFNVHASGMSYIRFYDLLIGMGPVKTTLLYMQ